MTLCLAKSIGEVGYYHTHDIMARFDDWRHYGAYTPGVEVFDIGNSCAWAIDRYRKGCTPALCGDNKMHQNGNGSLMRIHPFALYLYRLDLPIEKKIDIIHQASCLTHAHKRSQIACGIYAFVLWGILEENHISGIFSGLIDALEFYRDEPEMKHYIDRFDNFSDKKREDIKSSSYVVDTLESALWCLFNTNSYKDCVLLAVNLGDDADTIAAIAGSLAGALYGLKSIPSSWLNTLIRKDEIVDMCEKFALNK
jgi:ADP-ribosylglycohydrolase